MSDITKEQLHWLRSQHNILLFKIGVEDLQIAEAKIERMQSESAVLNELMERLGVKNHWQLMEVIKPMIVYWEENFLEEE